MTSLRLSVGMATRHPELRSAARIEAGLRAFLDAGGFTAFTDTFEDLGALDQLPGIAVQRLMADGYGFGAEGDWKAAALVRILKVMGDGLPGGTSFMEDYTYHLGDPVPEVLGAHMLEVCPSIADGRPSCEIHPLSIGGRADPVRLVFDARSGPAVVIGLADLGDRFRLIANEVDIVGPDAPLPKLPVARAVWRPRPDLATAAEAWLTAGGPHHTALTTSLGMDVLEDFADMANVELVTIDSATDRPGVPERAPLEPVRLLPGARAVDGDPRRSRRRRPPHHGGDGSSPAAGARGFVDHRRLLGRPPAGQPRADDPARIRPARAGRELP